LIVGIVHPCSRETKPAPQIRSGPPVPPAALRKIIRAKRNRANRSLASGKRFDATEDRDYNRSAIADEPFIEVMHPKSISRERSS
jgi:hypothetical protein